MFVLGGTPMKSVDDLEHHLQTGVNPAIAFAVYKIPVLHSSWDGFCLCLIWALLYVINVCVWVMTVKPSLSARLLFRLA